MISIIIPTCKSKNLLPCLESIRKHTDLSDVEIIVVANGYDGEVLPGVNIVQFQDMVGYPKAINAGIREAKGEFLVLLNDDTQILGPGWIGALREPFMDPNVAITGPWLMYNSEIRRDFICFFCCMIRKSVLSDIGLLDEVFTPGFGEDVDLSVKAVDAGFKIVQVPSTESIPYDGKMGVGNFPIYHVGGDTIKGRISPDRNHAILRKRYPRPSVYDCFLFFNELELLEIRFNELYDTVDHFVICETSQTHQGKSKPFYFEENQIRFSKFLDKVIHLKVNSDGMANDTWARERYQRDYLMEGLKNCKDNDIIIIGDADEIPSASAIKSYRPSMGLAYFDQIHNYYYLNSESGRWIESKILPYGQLKQLTPCGARYIYQVTRGHGTRLPDGGWHFSFCGGPERVKNKIRSYPHAEYNRPDILDRVEERISKGEDVFGRNTRYAIVGIDSHHPRYVQDNQQKFISLGFIR